MQSSFKTANDTYLKVTTAKYYLPSGRLIQALDYFHKSPDGKVTIVADSLTSVYKTKNGREVRDGRGITPDVTVEIKDNSKIAIALYYGHHFFDYANYFAATHPSIVAAEDFVITDSIFNDFKNFINVDKIKYDKKCEEMLTSLAKIAEEEGYEVVGEAVNGADGVEKYNSLKPDLVTMDITMPDMDGITALKNIKQCDPSAKVIMCSAMGQQAMVVESIQAGARDFIVKPFQRDRVIEAIKKVIG